MFKRVSILAVVTAVLAALLWVSSPAAQAQQQPAPVPSPGAMPNAVPSNKTPAVDDGDIRAVAKVGQTMVIGGNFTSVGGQARTQVAAFNPATGALTSFAPTLDGEVSALAPGPNASTVYIGGSFTSVNGTDVKGKVALLDLSTGALVPGFKASWLNSGFVRDFVKVGDRLITVGTFTKVGGVVHGGIAALDARTGTADHDYLNLAFTGRHNDSGSGAQGPVGPWNLDVTPDGSKLVVIGNFKYVDGQLRDQVAQVDLGATSATLADWRTERYSPYCYNWAYDSYVRGVSYSPDGSYFVIASTGGGVQNTLCDAAARFETATTGTGIQPTWVSESGGDTTWAVEITDSAVFVGGHQRWANNPFGVDRAQPGAVPRPGLMSLDPTSGRPTAWNPGRNPAGKAVYALLATDEGLWMGSNTDWVGNFKYQRKKLALFPYAGGEKLASTKTGDVPGTVLWGGNTAANPSTTALNTSRLTTGGAASTVVMSGTGVDWSKVRASMMVGPTVFLAQDDGYLHSRTFDGTTFGPDVKIDPYTNTEWANVDNNLGGTYNGKVPSLYGSQMTQLTGMFFDQGKLYYTRSGQSSMQARWFSPDSGIMDERTFSVTGLDFSQTRGVFVAAGKLYYIRSDGSLWRVNWTNGAPSGTPEQVSAAGGGRPDFRNRALFLYTGAPLSQAPTASFTSSCIDATCTFNGTGSTDPDGTIDSYAWEFGDGSIGNGATPQHLYNESGAYDVKLTVTDSDGVTNSLTKSVTVTLPANQAPTAVIGQQCNGAQCTFDASGSTDLDGSIANYAWDFGDGQTANGSSASHTYSGSGTFTVTLTVTDNRAGTGSTTSAVTVAPAASTISYVGASGSNTGGAMKKTVALPGGAQAGDLAVLYFSRPDTADFGGPTGVTGWEQLGHQANGSIQSTVWTKRLSAADLGGSVVFQAPSVRLGTAQVVVYRGVGAGSISIASAVGQNTAENRVPAVSVRAGDVVVRYVANRATATVDYSVPAGLVERGRIADTGSVQFDSVVAEDAEAALADGSAREMTITGSVPGVRSVWWSLALPSAP